MTLANKSQKESQLLRVRQLKILAFIAIALENLARGTWRFVLWGLLFIALWLWEIPTYGGAASEILIFILFCIGAAFFLWADARLVVLPRRQEIERRLEKESGAPHQPLSGLDDVPVQNSQTARRLWEREREKKLHALRSLQPFSPKALLAAIDPRALRLLIVLACIAGVWVAGEKSIEKIQRGLTPWDALQSSEALERITLIITPPSYTGQAQTILHSGQSERLSLPEGSTVKAIIRPYFAFPFFEPALVTDNHFWPLKTQDGQNYTLETNLAPTHNLTIKQGMIPLASWTISMVSDQGPKIEVNGKIEILEQGQMKIPVKISDDYGVQTLGLHMRLKRPITMALGKDVYETRPVMSPPKTEFEMTPVYDLTAHPWAGMPAIITLSALDHKNQKAQSEPIEIILPERPFSSPLAQRLIGIRKDIIEKPVGEYEPYALFLLSLLSDSQANALDMITRLSLRAACSRMIYNVPSVEISAGLIDLLWDTALHLEDGNLSLSARNLKNAQDELRNALQNADRNDEQISALMEKLKTAIAAYMQALAQEWQQRMQAGQTPPSLPEEMFSQVMNADMLQDMLDKLESDALSGDMKSAEEILSQLQRMMDMANPSMQPAMPKDLEAMLEAQKTLESIVEEQQNLLKKTQDQAELLSSLDEMGLTHKNSPPPFLNSKDNSAEQSALQQQLEALMSQLGENGVSLPESMPLAADAMDKAAQMLANGQPDEALVYQKEALNHLLQGQQGMGQQIAQRLKGMTGLSFFSGVPRRFDPLGRPAGEGQGQPGWQSDVKVPTEAERKRLQEIVNEIRRKAAQRERPQEELEYFRRLLKRF